MDEAVTPNELTGRAHITVGGMVQGVGFRPFVYRLAKRLGVQGWVANAPTGVLIEAEGPRAQVEVFIDSLVHNAPPLSCLQSVQTDWLAPAGLKGFEIRTSVFDAPPETLVLPDIATCEECLREVFDPNNRRFEYPFTNCTHCGPRFTILRRLPYDRPNTSMDTFTLCPACREEYENPADRRFHAQPNACPVCGPQVALWGANGEVLQSGAEAWRGAVDRLRRGGIVAAKGLGGFHLMAIASQSDTVTRLRQAKRRQAKPFALMLASIADARRVCRISALEEQLLRSPQAPIVLLRRLGEPSEATDWISPEVAPNNPYLGVMLPAMPLQHLLLRALGQPIVATSGNLSDEPICTDENEAVGRLAGIADAFLVHNRPILRHVDDSVVRVMGGREMVLRRARGFAPLPVSLPTSVASPSAPDLLAVGAHLKSCVALRRGRNVFLSQHIGDLETPQAYVAFTRVIEDFKAFYQSKPGAIAADLHPDYVATQYAESSGLPIMHVQHHEAHLFACMAEHSLNDDVLGVSWDGTGYGRDATIWGGEFLVPTLTGCVRFAHWRPFRLPGGDRAAREPRRSALGLLYEVFGDALPERQGQASLRSFSAPEAKVLREMLRKGVNAPPTSSVGRLFDALASLLNVRQRCEFEGQAAMELEFLAERATSEEAYPMPSPRPRAALASSPVEGSNALNPPLILDWEPLLQGVLADMENKLPPSVISIKIHNSLAHGIVQVAKLAGRPQVVLTGGCFQNRCLTERAIVCLEREGFQPFWHRLVPPNDGGIALGQIMAGLRLCNSLSEAPHSPEPGLRAQLNSQRRK